MRVGRKRIRERRHFVCRRRSTGARAGVSSDAKESQCLCTWRAPPTKYLSRTDRRNTPDMSGSHRLAKNVRLHRHSYTSQRREYCYFPSAVSPRPTRPSPPRSTGTAGASLGQDGLWKDGDAPRLHNRNAVISDQICVSFNAGLFDHAQEHSAPLFCIRTPPRWRLSGSKRPSRRLSSILENSRSSIPCRSNIPQHTEASMARRTQQTYVLERPPWTFHLDENMRGCRT